MWGVETESLGTMTEVAVFAKGAGISSLIRVHSVP